MRGNTPTFLWLLLFILVTTQTALAQTVVGRISGTVQD